ncbi:helix-turn-helix transcriptional regulator [Streptomyces sp. 3MP-14]|nr:response regulator transcription factor [Streptomyces sp. 3MP-14]
METHFARNEEDLVRGVRDLRPDVVVLTVESRRHWDRVEAEFPQHAARLLVIVDQHLLLHGGVDRMPADGYLVRQKVTAKTLARALSQLAAGEMAIPVEVGRRLLRGSGATPAANRPAALTAREREALLLLVHGLSNKQIGRRLLISEHGAKRLVGSVLLKLNANNRTRAVVNAIRAGLVDGAAMDA